MLEGRPVRSVKEPVGPGRRLQVLPSRSPPAPSLAPLRPLHEDEDVLVVAKPAGLLTSTVARERRPTAIAIVRAYLKSADPRARPGVIHRLDRDASGLLVFSKNAQAFDHLKRQFFRHTVDREYAAVVQGVPRPHSGRIESRLVELPDGRMVPTRKARAGQQAITQYHVIRDDGERALLQIRLHTGRKHQIRAQLSHMGHPVVGDRLYGGGEGPLMLAAVALAFDHPRTGRRVRFEVAVPDAFQQAVAHKP